MHFNDLRVNLKLCTYFISYRDSNIIWCINKVLAIFAKVNTDANAEDEECLTSPSEGAIPCHANYELPEMFIHYDVPFLIAR